MTSGMLADKYLPNFHFSAAHQILIHAPTERIWPLLDNLEYGDSSVIRLLCALRGMPRRSTNTEGLLQTRFVRLGQVEGKEMLMGLIGRFWRPLGDLITFKQEEFSAFEQSGYAKATWSFDLVDAGGGFTCVNTETRILCTDEGSRKNFTRYWFFVKPFSGIVRKEILKQLKRKAESET